MSAEIRLLPEHEGDLLGDFVAVDRFPAFDLLAHDAFDGDGQAVSDSPAGVDHSSSSDADDAVHFVQAEEGLLLLAGAFLLFSSALRFEILGFLALPAFLWRGRGALQVADWGRARAGTGSVVALVDSGEHHLLVEKLLLRLKLSHHQQIHPKHRLVRKLRKLRLLLL